MTDRPASAWARTTRQHTVDKVGRQGRRHLVQHQHVRFHRQRARKVKDAQRGQRQATGSRSSSRRSVRPSSDTQWRNGPPACRPAAGCRPPKVGDQRGFLIDRHQPRAARRGGRGDGAVAPPDAHMARVGLQRAGQDLHEGGFARAIGPHQRDDLARAPPASDASRRATTAPKRLATPCGIKNGGIGRSIGHLGKALPVERKAPGTAAGGAGSDRIIRPGLCRR